MRLALFQPDIPQNTGAVLRLAGCLGLGVDLIEPAGFVLTDNISFDVRYWDSDASNLEDPLGYGDGRVVGGIKLIW